MNKKEKSLFKRFLQVNDFLITNLTSENINEILSAYERFEHDLRKIVGKSKLRAPTPIWKKFSTMTEEEIIQEFSNVEKYPDLESIKSAVKGYIELRKVSKVKTRKTLIKHIIDTYRRGEFISKIGKEKKKNASEERIRHS